MLAQGNSSILKSWVCYHKEEIVGLAWEIVVRFMSALIAQPLFQEFLTKVALKTYDLKRTGTAQSYGIELPVAVTDARLAKYLLDGRG